MSLQKLGLRLVSAAAVSVLALSGAQAAEKWSMATPWSGGPIFEKAAKGVANDITLMTGGAVEFEVFPGGTLGKALKVSDTVRKGVAEFGHNWPGYDWGIDRTSVVFGGFAGTMPPEVFTHWLYQGEGADLWMQWRTEKFNIAAFPCSMGPREVFMHSHKRIETLADYRGVKMRTAGAWAEIAETLGASTVIMAGSEVYPALERKVVDAIEWGGPHTNRVMGYEKIAKYIIVPGIHQPLGAHECIVNMRAWEGLSAEQQDLMQKAGRLMVYDFYESEGHNDALAFTELLKGKNEIVDITQEFKDAGAKATADWAAKQGEGNEWFAKVWTSQQDYVANWKFAHRYR